MVKIMHETSQAKTESSRADFWLLLALFVSFRLLALLLMRPGGFIRDFSDFNFYFGIVQLSDFGLIPFRDFWLEWPPLVPLAMTGAYRLSLLIPQWTEEPRLWFVAIWGGVVLLFEAGNFWLIYRLARRLFADHIARMRPLWLYALLFAPVFTLLGDFDAIALFFILLGIDLLLAEKYRWAAVVAGIGFWVKVTPLIVAGVAAWLIWHHHRGNFRQVATGWLGYGATLVATALAVAAPFLLAAPQWLAAYLRAVLGRSSWETVWAVLEGYFGYGQLAGDRFNPAETIFAVHPPSLPWLWISLVFAALFLAAFFARPKDTSPRQVLAFAGFTIALFLLYSKGYSPQFIVYLLPFIILLLPNWAGVGYALALTALNILEQPVYFVMLPDAHWLLSAVVWLRFAVFVALAVEFWGQVAGFKVQGSKFQAEKLRGGRSENLASSLSHLFTFINRQYLISNLRIVVLAIIFIWMAALLPRAAGEYRAAQLERLPAGWMVSFLQLVVDESSKTVIVTNQNGYQTIYPFLHRQFRMRLVDDVPFLPAGVLQSTAKSIPAAWLYTAKNGGGAGVALAEMGKIVAEYSQFDSDAFELQLVDFSGAGIAPPRLASAERGIELAAASVQKDGDALDVRLFWHATGQLTALAALEVSRDFTVFTQLLSADGKYIAGHDSPPSSGHAPTGAWVENDLVLDSHTIELPADLPSGEYRLVVGMYDASGTRLPFFAPDGTPLPDAAIPVQTLRLP